MLAHELTHIRNGDVRMMVIAVIIAGVISFFAEMFFRMLFRGGVLDVGRIIVGTARRAAAAGAIMIAVALIALAWLLSVVVRFALSRSREFLADAGAVELTKNPGCHDFGLAQDRGPRRIAGRDIGGDGDVHRQSARGICRYCSPPIPRSIAASSALVHLPAGTIPDRWPPTATKKTEHDAGRCARA